MLVCLYQKLRLGVAVVKTTAIYLSESFYMVLMPIINNLFVFFIFSLLIVGGIYLLSLGSTFFLNTGDAFKMVSIDSGLATALTAFAFGGLWTLFWITSSSHFILSSSACIWYYNNASSGG
eukprot:GHVR01038841.1.p1 GENE.GHVR01038841.1~~GHVR01038841.1.p1  ORF type:complete len:121 (+),score=2.69 GHVR01038841.1:1755-2117(+)